MNYTNGFQRNGAADVSEACDAARNMLKQANLVEGIIDDLTRLNVAGECELKLTCYIIGTSCLLEQPIAAIVQGPSSSGKSYLIEKTASLFPPEAVIRATQMTPQALYHMVPGSLKHKFIVAGERSRVENSERAEATRALREMLSSGKLSKLMPGKEANQIRSRLIEQEGPIAYIESTTLTRIFDEDANRCILLNTDERPDQTRRIITAIAAGHGSATATDTRPIIRKHHALQRQLQPLPVVIPYAERLAQLFCTDQVEARRAFPRLVNFLEALTLLHQFQRETDAYGRLIATEDDYQIARHLLVRPMQRLFGSGVSEGAQRFYDRLQSDYLRKPFTATEIRNSEKQSKSSVHGWLNELQEAGLVETVEHGRGRSPARWRLTEKTLDDASGACLPTVADLFSDIPWEEENDYSPLTAI